MQIIKILPVLLLFFIALGQTEAFSLEIPDENIEQVIEVTEVVSADIAVEVLQDFDINKHITFVIQVDYSGSPPTEIFANDERFSNIYSSSNLFPAPHYELVNTDRYWLME